MSEMKIKVPSIIQLYTGPFGCGRTTSLINKYKEVQSKIDSSRVCYFFAIDGMCEALNREREDIVFLPYSNAKKLLTGNNDSFFIDDVDLFIHMEGLSAFDKIMESVGALYISCINKEFQKCISKTNENKIPMIKAQSEINYYIINYIESLHNVKIHKMKMKDNPGLPNEYISQVSEFFKYKE